MADQLLCAGSSALIKKHFAALLQNIKREDVHNAVKRNTVRLLQDAMIPDEYSGEVMQLCFDFIQAAKEKAAAKAFSLSILKNLSAKYPEIVPEIKLIIEARLPYETAAFKSRAATFLKKAAKDQSAAS